MQGTKAKFFTLLSILFGKIYFICNFLVILLL